MTGRCVSEINEEKSFSTGKRRAARKTRSCEWDYSDIPWPDYKGQYHDHITRVGMLMAFDICQVGQIPPLLVNSAMQATADKQSLANSRNYIVLLV